MVDVIVFDHDEDVLDGLAEALAGSGFSAATRHAAGTIHELATFVREQDPYVIVYDLGPPPWERALDRWRQLCREPGAHRPYVITTTAARLVVDEELCIASAVLRKPFTFDQVVEAVKGAMRN